MAIAKFNGQCRKCNKDYQVGDRILFFNFPQKGSPYHPGCVGKGQDWTKPEDEPQSVPLHPLTPLPREDEPSPSPAPTRVKSSDALLDIITDAVAERIDVAGLTDETKVREIASEEAGRKVSDFAGDLVNMVGKVVEQELAKQAPRVTVVELRRPEATPVTIEGAHYFMPRVAALMETGIHGYIWGPPGTGKTTVLMQLAEKLGRAWEVDTLDPSTPKSAILGYKNLDKSPSETAFSRTYVDARGLYIAEELDLASAPVQTVLNTALQNGHASFGWGMAKRGEEFCFWGNGNTPGCRTEAFPERNKMSEAFKDRLYFLYWPLDINIERRAVGAQLAPVPAREVWTCSMLDWQTWVEKTRAYCAANFPTLLVSPRVTHTGIRALAVGETPLEVAHGLVFRGLAQSSVDKILASCPVPRG